VLIGELFSPRNIHTCKGQFFFPLSDQQLFSLGLERCKHPSYHVLESMVSIGAWLTQFLLVFLSLGHDHLIDGYRLGFP
jgi:hypothetical protein